MTTPQAPAVPAPPASASAEATQSAPATPPASTPPAEPAKAEGTDWKAEARKWEARAKENTAAAKAYAELQEKAKSEEQKLAEKLAKLEAENTRFKVQELTRSVAAKHELPAQAIAFLRGSTEEELEASAAQLKEFIGAVVPAPRTGPAPMYTQGAPLQSSTASDPLAALTEQLRSAGLTG